MKHTPLLIANLDWVAALRSGSGSLEPDPVQAAALAEAAGALGIGVTIRESRDGIQDRDVRLLKETVKTPFHLSIPLAEAMVAIAEAIKPDSVTLVLNNDTTGAGEAEIRRAVDRLRQAGLGVGCRLAPDTERVKQAAAWGARHVVLDVSDCTQAGAPEGATEAVRNASEYAQKLGLKVRARGGIHHRNCQTLLDFHAIDELEVGHGLAARAVMVGLSEAVREVVSLGRAARSLVAGSAPA